MGGIKELFDEIKGCNEDTVKELTDGKGDDE